MLHWWKTSTTPTHSVLNRYFLVHIKYPGNGRPGEEVLVVISRGDRGLTLMWFWSSLRFTRDSGFTTFASPIIPWSWPWDTAWYFLKFRGRGSRINPATPFLIQSILYKKQTLCNSIIILPTPSTYPSWLCNICIAPYIIGFTAKL